MNLKRIDTEAGPLHIVLSSKWRLTSTEHAAAEASLCRIGLVIKGVTPDFSKNGHGDRVDEIMNSYWHHKNFCELAWVAIDSLDLVAINAKLALKNFVQTDDAVGLTSATADEAIAKLKAQREVVQRKK